MKEEQNENIVLEHRIEEMNPDTDQLESDDEGGAAAERYQESDQHSEVGEQCPANTMVPLSENISEDKEGEEDKMVQQQESEMDKPPPTNEIQLSKSPTTDDEDSNGGDQDSAQDPLQVAAAHVVLVSRRESSSSSSIIEASDSLMEDYETEDSETMKQGRDNEMSSNAPNTVNSSIDNLPTMTTKAATVDSICTAAGEAREQRANIRRAKREEEVKSCLGGTKESLRSAENAQPLSPGLLASVMTKHNQRCFYGVPMVLSSPMPQRNKGEKSGWGDDDYVLGLERDSGSCKFQQQQPGTVQIGYNGSLGLLEADHDSKPLSWKSTSEESKLSDNASTCFISAAVIGEESLQREFENKMKAEMVSAEAVEADDKAGFCQAFALKISCLSFLVIIGLVLGLGQTAQVTRTITNAPTMSPTPMEDKQYLEALFGSISGSEAFHNPASPQSLALQTISRESQEGSLNVRNVGDQYLVERYALRVLYYSTRGDAWFLTDHNFVDSTLNTCSWMNVTQGNRLLCNEDGEVTDLFLNLAGLNGTIPAELGVLTSLSQLSLAKNSLYGSIPSSLGDLKDIKFMQFALNELSGSIPSTFERFTKLERFIMHVNQLTGSLPKLWGEEFRRLRINDNRLTGSIPDMPTQMPLDWFQVSENAFTGTLPKNLAAQPKLITLAVSNNLFEGTIPEQYSALTLLENFVVDGNLLEGTLPSMLGKLTEIDWFWVNDNNLSGVLPNSLQALAKATQFKFQNNNFTGTLPNDWSSLESLISLDVSSNPNLEGTVPASYIGLEALASFALAGTRVSGGLADSFCVTQQLDSLSAECGGDVPFIDCPCCTTCCDQGSCALQNLDETCSSRADTLQTFDQFRDGTCSCTNDSTQVACTESCESCSLDGSSCVQSSAFGHNLNPIDGERLDFFNTFEYTTGRYSGTTIAFQESVIDDLTDECEVTVNGEKCRACRRQVCKSDLVGLTIVCDNLSTPAEIKTCDDQPASSSYLDAFTYWDPARVSGCNLNLYRVIEDSN